MSTAVIFNVSSAGFQNPNKVQSLSAPSWMRVALLLSIDLGSLLIALLATAMLKGVPANVPYLLSQMVHITIPMALLCASGVYAPQAMHPTVELKKLISAITLANVLVVLLLTGSASGHSPVVIIQGFLLQGVCLVLSRVLFRALMTRLGLWLTPTMIIGSGSVAQSLVRLLEKHKHIGLKPVAILGDNTDLQSDGAWSHILFDHPENARHIQQRYGLSHVIIADPALTAGGVDTIPSQYTEGFKNVVWIPGCPAVGSLAVRTVDLGGLLGLEMPSLTPGWAARVSKRIFDVVLASFAFIAFLPAFALLYLIIRLSSPGPVFYGQRRIGQGGKSFTVWKFRSMVVNAEAALEEALAKDPELRQQWEKNHKLPNDPRISRIGKFLRVTSLDELPQLWNIIRGDMSLVGPRPIVDAEVSRYAGCFQYYTMVRPGVTGMWQISGRSNTSYAERVSYDEYFVKNWSIWMDVYILFRTIKTVALREGAC